jgi:structure-specific recognition protein 1
LAGKNEVAVEFALPTDGQTNGVNGHLDGSTKNRGRKAAAGPDELVEMRFYIPGTALKKEKTEDVKEGEEEEEEEEEGEEQNAANLFYETLMDKAEIGDVAGDTFATFLDVLHLTPRYEILAGRRSTCLTDENEQRSFRYRYVRILLPVTW